MSIRRRTFFGQTSNKDLGRITRERELSDILISDMETLADLNGEEVNIPVDLLKQNCKDREMRMAANAEHKRREERMSQGIELRRGY